MGGMDFRNSSAFDPALFFRRLVGQLQTISI
jgi:hypothetical protein